MCSLTRSPEQQRIAEIRERLSDNFRELGNDEWRGQYRADIDFLLSQIEEQDKQIAELRLQLERANYVAFGETP